MKARKPPSYSKFVSYKLDNLSKERVLISLIPAKVLEWSLIGLARIAYIFNSAHVCGWTSRTFS